MDDKLLTGQIIDTRYTMNSERCQYELISEQLVIEETGVLTYGVSLRQGEVETARFGDLSPDRERVMRLVCLLNKMDAQSVHLEDILEDFLP